MKTKILTTALLSTMAMSAQAAVSLSPTGQGDLVILPYYSVKNNMNTTYTVVNHSSTQTKLVQISYKESKNNHDVLFYNVFLKPNSSWSLGLAPVESTINEHEGEPSVVQYHNSSHCAPFLTQFQEFLPYAYEAEDDTSLSLERAQEGHIEIYEIGSIDPNNEAIDLDNCGGLSGIISGNETFLNEHLNAPSGELSATASLLNVNEGASYSYNGVAFNHFTDQSTFDFEKFPHVYDFNNASTSAMINNNGTMIETTWNSGAESINALIASQGIGADFGVETSVNAQSEVVLTLPGKIYMNSSAEAIAPFTQTYNSNTGSCETAGFSAYNRDGDSISTVSDVDLCWASQVIKLNAQTPSELSEVLMSQHEYGVTPSSDSGRIQLDFNHTMQSTNGVEVKGLPVLGFSIQRLTNANAAPGLMAQYGSLFQLKAKKIATTQ